MGQLHAFVHRQQCGCCTLLSWKSKPASRDENIPNLFFSLTITVALVVLICRDQLVQFGITVLLGDTAGDSGLNPLQYLVIAACSSHRSTIYPQEYVIVWCSTCLIFFLKEVVRNSTQYLSLYNDRLEEIVKFL